MSGACIFWLPKQQKMIWFFWMLSKFLFDQKFYIIIIMREREREIDPTNIYILSSKVQITSSSIISHIYYKCIIVKRVIVVIWLLSFLYIENLNGKKTVGNICIMNSCVEIQIFTYLGVPNYIYSHHIDRPSITARDLSLFYTHI